MLNSFSKRNFSKRNLKWKRNYCPSTNPFKIAKNIQTNEISKSQALASLIESLSFYGAIYNKEVNLVVKDHQKQKDSEGKGLWPYHIVDYFVRNKVENPSQEWILKGIQIIEGFKDFLHHPRLTMKLLQLYCKSDQIEKATSLLLQEPTYMSRRHYHFIMNSYVKQRKVTNAKTIFDLMKSRNITPNEYSYSIMMNMYTKLGLSKMVEEIFLDAISNSVIPNATLYTSLLISFLQSGDQEKAQYFLNELLSGKAKIEVDIKLYTVILNHYCKIGEVQNVCKVLAYMENNNIKKDYYIYTALMGLYQNLPTRLIHEYHYLFDVNNITELNPVLFQNMLIDRHLKKGEHESAFEVFDTMKDKGITPDELSFTLIMTSCLMEKKYSKVQLIYDFLMVRDSISTAQLYVIFHIVIKMYRRTKKEDKIKATLNQMRKKGLSPILTTYSLLAQFYGDMWQFEKCKEIINEMHTEGIAPDIALYNSLMKYARRAVAAPSSVPTTNALTIEYVVENMNKYQIKSDLLTFVIAFDVLFQNMSLSQEEKRQQANQIFEELCKEGLTPNIRIFICLMRYALNFKDAMTIYEKMKSLQIKPNFKLFETMISVWLADGKASGGLVLTSLLSIFDLMFEEEMKPQINQMNMILTHCNKSAEKNIAEYIIEVIEKLRITTDGDTIIAQMRIFPDQAENIFLQARQNGTFEIMTVAYNAFLEIFVNPKMLKSNENIKKFKDYLLLMERDGVPFDAKTYTSLISFYYIIEIKKKYLSLQKK